MCRVWSFTRRTHRTQCIVVLRAEKGHRVKSAEGIGRWLKSRKSRCKPLSPLPLHTCQMCCHGTCEVVSTWEAHQSLSAQGRYWRLLTEAASAQHVPDLQTPSLAQTTLFMQTGAASLGKASGYKLKIQKSLAFSTAVVRAYQIFHVYGKKKKKKFQNKGVGLMKKTDFVEI